MKILFVTYDLGYTDSIAIAFLSAIAKQLHHSTFYCSLDRNNLSAEVKKIKPDVVGYSVNIYGYAKIVKEHKKAKKIHDFISIMGGPHPTTAPETFSDSGMDAYCIGEGEYAFRDFLTGVEKGRSFDNVANLITKNKRNPVRPLVEKLDELPMPDRDLVFSNTFHKKTPKKTFFTSRGCPFSCAYCCNNIYKKIYHGKGKFVRRFSVERILREIEDVRSKYRMDFVKFDDDCFAIKADDWLEEFAEKYPKRIGLPFNCLLRFDRVDNKMLKLLKKAGCHSLHFSIDSTSEHVRENVLNRQMKQNINIIKKFRMVRKYGIYSWVNYMTAVPESTWKDDLNTIFVNKKAKITYSGYSTTTPMKGTDLYNYCLERGYIQESSYYKKMPSFFDKSSLSCFDEREKKIRRNVNLLGAIASKMPFPLDMFIVASIITLPPNKFFEKLYHFVYQYYMTKKIYKFPG
jgi:radical SAM superfamily enzyme YgiQ (UPF0313 family)